MRESLPPEALQNALAKLLRRAEAAVEGMTEDAPQYEEVESLRDELVRELTELRRRRWRRQKLTENKQAQRVFFAVLLYAGVLMQELSLRGSVMQAEHGKNAPPG